jgi:uncharacterized phage-like protein YoqJ
VRRKKMKKDELELDIYSIIEEEIYYIQGEGILGMSRAAGKIVQFLAERRMVKLEE